MPIIPIKRIGKSLLKSSTKAAKRAKPKAALKRTVSNVADATTVQAREVGPWDWTTTGATRQQAAEIKDVLELKGLNLTSDDTELPIALQNVANRVLEAKGITGGVASIPASQRREFLASIIDDPNIVTEVQNDILRSPGTIATSTKNRKDLWFGTGPEGSKPSGPNWDDYVEFEKAHWAEHGRGSKLYYSHNDQNWRLDLKDKAKQKFSAKNLAVKGAENTNVSKTRGPGLALTTLDPEQLKAGGRTRKGSVHRHHANAAKLTEKALYQYERNLNPNWTPDMGRSPEGTKFLKNLQNRLGISAGDMLANYRDYPKNPKTKKSPIHTKAHRLMSEGGIDPRLVSFEGMSNDEIWEFFQNTVGPTIKNIDEQLGFKSQFNVKTGGAFARNKLKIKPPKKTEPTQFPEQIQRHIARSAEIGITEPVWKNGSIDYTWRPETNTGQIDIPPQSAKGFKGLRDEFFEQIENLPSGSVWELNPKFKDEKRRRIYARLFGNDPRITRNPDPTLGWVLRVP